MPTTLGAGTNEDRVVVVRADVVRLYTAPAILRIDRHSQSGTLTNVAVVARYVAFSAARLPASIVVIDGTGLVTP